MTSDQSDENGREAMNMESMMKTTRCSVSAFFLVISTLLLSTSIAQAQSQSPGVWLGELTWPEAEVRLKEAPIVILPVGAGAKEHGHHLPMNADAVVLDYLAGKAIEAQPVVVAPPILHGWFAAFSQFPGTEVNDPAVFQAYVLQVAESLVRHGAQRIVFLNTGINKASGLPLSIVARQIRSNYGVPTLVLSWDDLETEEVIAYTEQERGGHSDEIETSINLALQPERVKMERARAEFLPERGDYPGYQAGLFSRDPADPAYNQTGVHGDPTRATAEKGWKTLAIMERELLRALDGFANAPTTRKPGAER